MNWNIQGDAPPFREDPPGTIRIGATRVLLEIVIRAFQDGATPETIVHRYSTLSLAEVYATIAYYLRHTTEIDGYLAERERLAEKAAQRMEVENKDLGEIRIRLLRARRAREAG